jgi:group I intron endonuclease
VKAVPAVVGEWLPLLDCRRLPQAGGLYILRQISTGKEYVGMSVNVQLRAYKHAKPRSPTALIARTVRAHGAQDFEIMLYRLDADPAVLLALEMEMIAERGTRYPAGLNLTAGGEGSAGYTHPPEVQARITAALTGKKRSAEAIAKTAAANRGMVMSEAQKQKISATKKGVKNSEAHRLAIAAGKRGRPLSAANRESISRGHKLNPKILANMRKLGAARRRAVLLWTIDALVPREFESVSEAADYAGVTVSMMSGWCLGKYRQRAGWAFTYAQ